MLLIMQFRILYGKSDIMAAMASALGWYSAYRLCFSTIFQLGIESHDFENAAERVHEDQEEDEDTTSRDTAGVTGEVIEDTTNNQGLEEIHDEHGDSRTRVPLEQQPAAPQGQGYLLPVRERKWRLRTLKVGLITLSRSQEALVVFTIEGVSLHVGVNVLVQLS